MADSKQVAFRAEPELLERLDRLVEFMRKHPDFEGLDINRSVAIRVLVHRGLSSMELRLGVPHSEDAFEPEHEVVYRWVSRLRDATDEVSAIHAFLETLLARVKTEPDRQELQAELEKITGASGG